MTKYTPDHLRRMAADALEAKAVRDDRYMMLVMTLCVATGLNTNEVERRMQQLAKTGECELWQWINCTRTR